MQDALVCDFNTSLTSFNTAPVRAPLSTANSASGKSFSRRPQQANDLLEAALRYTELGLPITLCEPGSKKPITADWPNHKWTAAAIHRSFRDQATLNVGLILGEHSGLVDFDCDGEAAEETFFELFGGEDIATPTWQSKRGRHRLFQWHPALEQLAKSKLKLGGDGAELELLMGPAVQTMLPPSWSDYFCRKWVSGQELFPYGVGAIPDSVLRKLGCCLDGCVVAGGETALASQYTDSIPTSVVSVVSVYSHNQALTQQIMAIVESRIVRTPGTTNEKFVGLAIALKGLPELADTLAEDLEPFIRYWYDQSLPAMQDKCWSTVWERWMYLWLWAKPGHDIVRLAFDASQQEPLPSCAYEYRSKVMQQLVGLCRMLQVHNADDNGVWYLSCRSASEVLGVTYRFAAQLLKMLVANGVLEIAAQSTEVRATRYRYRGN